MATQHQLLLTRRIAGSGGRSLGNVIEVLDYDERWPRSFETERTRLSVLLGDLLDDIHHVGSTSVVGLPAKPKIDIDAVLRNDSVVTEAVERVQGLFDYTFHGTPYDDGMWTFTSGHGSWGARLYLSGPNNPTHMKRILFRDWLRTHPSDAADYAALKRRLAVDADGDWRFYTGGKTEFVARIVHQAETAIALETSQQIQPPMRRPQ